MPSAGEIFGLIAMVSAMGLVVAFAVFHTKRIRPGRADPIVSPGWTSIERPTTPLTSIR